MKAIPLKMHLDRHLRKCGDEALGLGIFLFSAGCFDAATAVHGQGHAEHEIYWK
jgi:hypothetical protein